MGHRSMCALPHYYAMRVPRHKPSLPLDGFSITRCQRRTIGCAINIKLTSHTQFHPINVIKTWSHRSFRRAHPCLLYTVFSVRTSTSQSYTVIESKSQLHPQDLRKHYMKLVQHIFRLLCVAHDNRAASKNHARNGNTQTHNLYLFALVSSRFVLLLILIK